MPSCNKKCKLLPTTKQMTDLAASYIMGFESLLFALVLGVKKKKHCSLRPRKTPIFKKDSICFLHFMGNP